MAKRISIINFKGGVGKTTLAFHLATGLTRYHDCRVLLMDMDHQSSLSIVCLGPQSWEQAVSDHRTVDEIFRPFVGQAPQMPGEEIIFESPMRGRLYSAMDLVPASLQLDDTEIELTASHHGNAIQSEWDKRTLVCRWLEETGLDDRYDLPPSLPNLLRAQCACFLRILYCAGIKLKYLSGLVSSTIAINTLDLVRQGF